MVRTIKIITNPLFEKKTPNDVVMIADRGTGAANCGVTAPKGFNLCDVPFGWVDIITFGTFWLDTHFDFQRKKLTSKNLTG